MNNDLVNIREYDRLDYSKINNHLAKYYPSFTDSWSVVERY
jgi:hypothetical protein